jgi:AcrR family transcriptional regulator
MVDALKELSTRDMLIEATSRRLWNEDESEIRILDICQETNLSTSVIYGHFRSRQGLIDAALLHIFTEITDGMVEGVTAFAQGEHPTGSYVDTLYSGLTNPAYEARVTTQRRMFFRVSASALSRPSIRQGFLRIYDSAMERLDPIYEDLIERKLLSDQLTGRQWALFFEGQMLSRAFHDLFSNWDNQEDWLKAARQLLEAARPKS